MANLFSQAGNLMKLQKEARKMQKEMKSTKVSGLSKNEDVEIVIDGTHEIIELGISDDLLRVEKKVQLVNAIIQAMKDAQKKLQKDMMKSMDIDKLKGMLG
jgi:DNA-binding protein YbaB